jgi:hypothetical protein
MEPEHVPYWILFEAGKSGESVAGPKHVFRYVARERLSEPRETGHYRVVFEGHPNHNSRMKALVRKPRIPILTAERLQASTEILIRVSPDRDEPTREMRRLRAEFLDDENLLWERISADAQEIVDLATLYIATTSGA